MRRYAALCAFILLTGACAARPPVAARPPAQPVIDVEAQIRRGCYRCLESASTAASATGATEKAFEVALLLAARSKELGLPPGLWLERALTILPPGPGWPAYFDIVSTQPTDPLTGDRDVLAEALERRRPPATYDKWRAALREGPGSPMMRAYLDLVVVCRPQLFQVRDEAVAAVLVQFDDVPLLQYRAGLCGGAASGQLAIVRDGDPEFVDADLEMGRRAIQDRVRPDLVEGLVRLRSARAAFPTSPVIPILIGNLHETTEEFSEALAEYEATLTLVPTHPDAMLGRTVSLSNLDRHEEALASATKLLDLGSVFTGEARYWRAWNQYRLDRIQAARADADLAKTLMANPQLFMLSGLIEWREQRLESGAQEFQRAIEMDFGQCEAAFYLGSIRSERRLRPENLAAFVHAQQCFELSIVTRRQVVTSLSTTPDDAALNARQIASHERAIAASARRFSAAAQNVALIRDVAIAEPDSRR